MSKRDVKKELRPLYGASRDPIVVDVPPLTYLMVDGEGDPNVSPAYQDAVEALFSVSYAVKFAVKKADPSSDYGVMPLEGVWWADDMASYTLQDKGRWRWTMMILQPDLVTRAMVEHAIAMLREKKEPPALPKLRLERFHEGKAAQLLHVGPFTDEGPAIARLHAFIEAGGGRLSGKHHEIYLTDIRRADPSKWKTVIRQPFE